MRAAVVVFPGSNCDRDLAVALRRAVAEAVQAAVLDAPLVDWEARRRAATPEPRP